MNDHLSIGGQWRITSLRFDQGVTPNQIASTINCSRTTVFNILRLFCETNNVTEREGRNRALLNNMRRIRDNITIDRMIENLLYYQMMSFLFYNLLLSDNNLKNQKKKYVDFWYLLIEDFFIVFKFSF